MKFSPPSFPSLVSPLQPASISPDRKEGNVCEVKSFQEEESAQKEGEKGEIVRRETESSSSSAADGSSPPPPFLLSCDPLVYFSPRSPFLSGCSELDGG